MAKRPVAFRVPRTDPDAAGELMSKMEYRLFSDEDEASDAAEGIGCDYDGLYLRDGVAMGEGDALEAAIDRMGWPEINAFQVELKRGQDIREDAGGFMMRAIRRLFGLPAPYSEVETYQSAARKMVAVQEASESANHVIQYLEDECGLDPGLVSKADRSNVANAILNGRAALQEAGR